MHNPIAWLGRCKSDILEKVLYANIQKVMSKVLGSVTVPSKWDPVEFFHSQLIFLEDTMYCWGAHSIYVSKIVASLRIWLRILRIVIALLAKTKFTIAVSCSSVNLAHHETFSPFHSVEDSRTVWVYAINCNIIYTILYSIVRMSSYSQLYCCTVW